MRKYAASLVILGLAATVAAQEFASPEPVHAKPDRLRDQALAAASASYRDFLQQAGGTWRSHWNPATATPKAIYGTGLPLPGWTADSLAMARLHGEQILARYRELLGLGTSEFREEIAGKMGGTWVLVYDQFFRGLPVIGGRADIRIHESGALSMFGSKAWPIPDWFGTVPVIDELNAVRLAWQNLGVTKPEVTQPGNQHGPRLVIWGDVEAAEVQPFHLAWEVPVSAVQADGTGPIGRCYIDGSNGRVLHYENDKHECGNPACAHPHHRTGGDETVTVAAPPAPISGTVMGWTRTGLSAVSQVVNIPLAGLEVVVSGVGTAITDQNGFFTINSSLTAPVNITVSLNGIHNQLVAGANAPTVTQSVTPGTPASFQLLTSAATSNEAAHTSTYHWVWLVNEFCRSILGNSSQLATADNVRPTVNIASTCNAYYTGNTINFYAAGGSCNNTGFSTVVAHEWGHGLDDRYGGVSQTNGLGEGWADIVAMYLAGDAIVGRDFRTSGAFVRTGTNSRQYPVPTTSSVHAQGEPWMGFSWKLRERLRLTQGSAPGITVANTIVIGSIIANARNQPDAVREVFLADDNDANLLNGTPHYNELEYACNLHSLPFPEIQLGIVAHAPLTNTTRELTPRRVDATVTPSLGSFTQVNLHYDTGGGATSVPMVPSGGPNGYVALLPGALAPANASYHFEALHSTGPSLRWPSTGEFSYFTGAVDQIFFDGFETGAAGWTHGLVATQDDWQLGSPAGRSGTSGGVSWADPSAAASGANCYANDLGNTIGGQAWNGAYQPNVYNWLRSPVINCSGRTGVTLRMKRWLTVEEATYDRATIHVNGTQVWINPTGPHILDTAWVTLEIPIPQADNNPAVTLEWRLVTDGGLNLGGWNIDDVDVFAPATVPPLDAQLRITPEMPQIGSAMGLGVVIRPSVVFALLLGDSPGPIIAPGLPLILVGGNLVTLVDVTNAFGFYTSNFNAPNNPALVGSFWYSQVLTLDPVGSIVASNQFINLFRN